MSEDFRSLITLPASKPQEPRGVSFNFPSHHSLCFLVSVTRFIWSFKPWQVVQDQPLFTADLMSAFWTDFSHQVTSLSAESQLKSWTAQATCRGRCRAISPYSTNLINTGLWLWINSYWQNACYEDSTSTVCSLASGLSRLHILSVSEPKAWK